MDDLLVSAPMYSPEIDKPEYGIVFVYRNDQVSFKTSCVLATVPGLQGLLLSEKLMYVCVCVKAGPSTSMTSVM